jgi:hypothetical protein
VRLEAFEGEWAFVRAIEDLRAGRQGRFIGRAAFRPAAGGGLDYREEGMVTFDGGPAMTASRDYRWRDGGGGVIEVRFGDGRFFHRFLPEGPETTDVHLCGPDTYRVRYDFARWPQWRADWRVTGPRKDYSLVSRYRRVGR